MRDYKKYAQDLRRIAQFQNCFECYEGERTEGSCSSYCTLNKAADAIEELLAKDTNVPNKWISVEERLPEDSGYAIVFCADGNLRHVTFAKYLKTPKRWELSGARSYWRVLNWMPLPEPPKGD